MSDFTQRPKDLEGRTSPSSRPPKVLFAGEEWDGQPYLYIDEQGIALVADSKKALSVSSELGISLTGLLNLSVMPEQVQFGGGYWTINPQVMSTLPSTTATPIPWLTKKDAPRLLAGRAGMSGAIDGAESLSDIAGL